MLNELITTSRFRPRFRALADDRGQTQARISRVSGIPYQTVQNYYNGGDGLKGVRFETLYAYLRGIGMSDDEILSMPLGELFEIVRE